MPASENNILRELPFIDQNLPPPTRPISFVCVRFSNEFEHNIVKSECVHFELNEFIIVDNTANLHFKTLGDAMNFGISQAKHELIVVVHEDVLLLPGWQSLFERSLGKLESEYPQWLLLGVIGWLNSVMKGCCGDPKGVYNSDWRGDFEEADNFDEQLLIFKKSANFLADTKIPTIHNYGQDFVRRIDQLDSKAFVIRAPSVHKYANANGEPTLSAEESEKILNRKNYIYKLHKSCSDEYLHHKWPEFFKPHIKYYRLGILTKEQNQILRRPIILLGSQHNLNQSITENAQPSALMYSHLSSCNSKNGGVNTSPSALHAACVKTLFRQYLCPSIEQQKISHKELKHTAFTELTRSGWPSQWGFAIEESAYILKELANTFPEATYVSVVDSKITDLAPYSTQYLNNELGRTLTLAAYTASNIEPTTSLTENNIEKSNKLHTYRENLISNFFTERSRNFGVQIDLTTFQKQNY